MQTPLRSWGARKRQESNAVRRLLPKATYLGFLLAALQENGIWGGAVR